MDLVKLLNEVSDALSQSPVSGERARLAQRCLDAVAALQPGGEREVYAALIEDAAKVCESLAVADLTQAHDAIADLKVRAPVAVSAERENTLVAAIGLLVEHCPEQQPVIQRLQLLLRAPVAVTVDERIAPIFAELERATVKFPTWPTDPLHAFAVVGEEFGECQKEVLQLVYEPHKSSPEEVRKEAIQMAAMALRFVMSLDLYKYTPGEQHKQAALYAALAGEVG